MSVNTTNNNAINTIYSQNANEQIRKDEKKEAEMLAALIDVLEDVVSTVATSQSGTPAIGAKKLAKDSKKLSDAVKGEEGTLKTSSSPAQTNALTSTSSSSSSPTSLYPSPQEMADALAAMAAMVTDLQGQIEKSSDEHYQMACQIMLKEIELSMNVLTNYIYTANYVDTEWAKYNQYISDHMKQYQDWMNHEETHVKTQMIDGQKVTTVWTTPDPLVSNVENDIKKYCKNEFGIDIYLDPNCTDLNAIINSANQQVYAYLTSLMDSATNQVEDAFLYSTNPTLQQIGKMIFNDAAINEEALKTLELILSETLNKLTIMANTSTTNYNEGPSSAMVIQILSTMTSTISNLEAMISKIEAKQADNSTKTSKKFGDAAKMNLQKVKDQLDHIQKLTEEIKKDEQMNKIAGIVLTAAMGLLAIVTGNVALVLIMITMTVLEDTGEMDKFKDYLTKQYTNFLVKNGESQQQAEKDAKILADVTIIAAVAAGSFGVGAIEAELENAFFEGASTISKSTLQAVMMALQESTSTQLTTDVTTSYLSAHTHLSDDEIKRIAMIAEIIADISAIAATLGCGYGMSSASTEEAGVAGLMRKLSGDHLSTIFLGSSAVQFGGSMVEMGANIDRSINLKAQAGAEEKLGESKANLSLFLDLQDMTNTIMQDNMQGYLQMLNSRQRADSDMLRTMLSFQAEYTKVLSQSA